MKLSLLLSVCVGLIGIDRASAAGKQLAGEHAPASTPALSPAEAQKKFTETAEGFTNAVYEQSDSLKPTADRLKLEVKTAIGMTRKPAPGVTGALANPKFLNAIFSPDTIEKKRNTEAVEVASNQLISGRVTQYTPARTRPLPSFWSRSRPQARTR